MTQTKVKKFVKLPREIDAIQLTKSNWDAINEFLGMENWRRGEWWANPLKNEVGIVTLEGTMVATENDWIIKGVQGEFYPIKNDIFLETYKAVED
jgi:hypothetical protein